MPRIKQIIETLEAERTELQARLEWIDVQLEEFRAHAASLPEPTAHPTAPTPPPRSGRRSTASRASARRAAARVIKHDIGEDILKFLHKHPSSTAGDIAKGTDHDRNAVAARLSQLVKMGEVKKVKRGFRAIEDSTANAGS